jgi:hypothetical protein
MELVEVSPFCCKEYQRRTKGFVSWVVTFVQANNIHGRIGWGPQFESYIYSRHGGSCDEPVWLRGVLRRAEFHRKLLNSIDDDSSLMGVVNDIMDWGGMRQYSSGFAPSIRKALYILKSERDDKPWIVERIADLDAGDRIAPISKVYQMFDPHKWTIYDSRVAVALACLVRRFWTENGEEVNSDLLRFPIPPRRRKDWHPPAGFQVIGGGHRGSLAFLYASWLLRLVAEILRADPKYSYPAMIKHANRIAPLDASWQVYHVEMALWMMGDKDF